MTLNELIKRLEELRVIDPSYGELPVKITLADYYDGWTGNAQAPVVTEEYLNNEYQKVIAFR